MLPLKSFLKIIIFINLLFITETKGQFLFTPFENNTNFKGAWDLSLDFPNYIAAYFREFEESRVLSASAFNSFAEGREENFNINDLEFVSGIANEFEFQFIITGKITEFSVSRFTAGDPTLAGYESYACKIIAFVNIYSLEKNEFLFNNKIENEFTSKSLGITLFGKPTTEKEQFFGLNTIRFGGEEFAKTIVGETMIGFCDLLLTEIKTKDKEIFRIKKTPKIKTEPADVSLDDIKLNTEVIKGSILTYDETTGEAFINLGSGNNIKIGDELGIYTEADSLFDPSTNEFLGLSDSKISFLEIIEVRGEKLSLALIKENRDKVKTGMEIRKLIIRKRD